MVSYHRLDVPAMLAGTSPTHPANQSICTRQAKAEDCVDRLHFHTKGRTTGHPVKRTQLSCRQRQRLVGYHVEQAMPNAMLFV
jgi:hypothetical protein